ncbi:hypothetical protein LCGC14_3002920, partial [marine sediment metagenome]
MENYTIPIWAGLAYLLFNIMVQALT